jgi:hypothetical protein
MGKVSDSAESSRGICHARRTLQNQGSYASVSIQNMYQVRMVLVPAVAMRAYPEKPGLRNKWALKQYVLHLKYFS